MLIESLFTPPHFLLANGLGTEAEVFKSWYVTPALSSLAIAIKEMTSSQWCRHEMVELY